MKYVESTYFQLQSLNTNWELVKSVLNKRELSLMVLLGKEDFIQQLDKDWASRIINRTKLLKINKEEVKRVKEIIDSFYQSKGVTK